MAKTTSALARGLETNEPDLEHLAKMLDAPIEDISDKATRDMLVQRLARCLEICTRDDVARAEKCEAIGEALRHAYVLGRWSILISLAVLVWI